MGISVNGTGRSHAASLITAGKVDKDSSWSFDAEDGNKILGNDDWSEYGSWFLGIDAEVDPKTKAHYHYPFGKNGKVYRSALTAIRQRAGQQGADDIFKAAGSLLEKIDGKKEGDSFRPDIERRTIKMDFRAATVSGIPTIRGVAAVFNSISEDLGGFREQIAPGAFRSAIIEGCDVRALFNHDPSMILGRTKSKTLRLFETDQGLEFECDLPDTSYARDLMACMRRGDINQCSFGFQVDDGGDTWQKDAAGQWMRTLHVVSRLYDVSAVVYPAYPDTACAVRSLEKAQEGFKPPFNDIGLRKMRIELEEAAFSQ
jgi:HK97 family phage prohead protease